MTSCDGILNAQSCGGKKLKIDQSVYFLLFTVKSRSWLLAMPAVHRALSKAHEIWVEKPSTDFLDWFCVVFLLKKYHHNVQNVQFCLRTKMEEHIKDVKRDWGENSWSVHVLWNLREKVLYSHHVQFHWGLWGKMVLLMRVILFLAGSKITRFSEENSPHIAWNITSGYTLSKTSNTFFKGPVKMKPCEPGACEKAYSPRCVVHLFWFFSATKKMPLTFFCNKTYFYCSSVLSKDTRPRPSPSFPSRNSLHAGTSCSCQSRPGGIWSFFCLRDKCKQ